MINLQCIFRLNKIEFWTEVENKVKFLDKIFVHQEMLTSTNIWALAKSVLKFLKPKLTELKGKTNNFIVPYKYLIIQLSKKKQSK